MPFPIKNSAPAAGGFPREQTSGTSLSLPDLKAPMITPPVPATASLPAAMPTITKAPKLKGATVSPKKPRPPSSRVREQNGM